MTNSKLEQENSINNSNQFSKKEINSLSNEELIELYENHDYSLNKIEKYFGLSRNSMRRLFKKRNIDYNLLKNNHNQQIKSSYDNNPNRCLHCGKPLDWEHRTNKYCSNSCAASENNKGILRNSTKRSNQNKLSENNLNNKLVKIKRKDLEITYKDKRSAKLHNSLILTKYSELNIPKIEPGQCIICGSYHCNNQFCKEHNFQQLIGFVEHLGFNPTFIGTTKVFDEFKRIHDLVYNLYWVQNKSCIELETMFNYKKGTIYDVFNYLEIPRRDLSSAVSNSFFTGRSIIHTGGTILSSKQNWHITWLGEKVFLRSSYELDYAVKLDEQQIYYEVESIRIPYFDTLLNSERIAIPDFYLPTTNELVEIKSDFTLDIQEMIDKFKVYKLYGYNPKLILEHKEVDLYNIENLIDSIRLDRIRNKNIKQLKINHLI